MTNHLKIKHKLSDASSSTTSEHQPKITAFKTPVKMSTDKLIRCHRKLAAWCAQDLRPLSIVDGRGFKAFMTEVAPTYAIPSRPTVHKYLEIEYAEKCGLLTNMVMNKPIALTTDMWTSAGHDGYVTCTAHFLGDDWTSHNYVLATRIMKERHSGVNMAGVLRSIIDQFNIEQSDIVGLLTDNASNMYKCAEELKWPHFPCFAHTLQLSVRAGLNDVVAIKKTIAACKRVVAYFHKSTLASTELAVKQQQNQLPKHVLISDVETRWNSTYQMMERLLEQRIAIYAVLMDSKIIKKSDAATLDMTDNSWAIMENIISVLKPFYVATSVMSSEEYPTLSVILPILTSLLRNHLHDNEADCAAVASYKTVVKKQLTKRYDIDNPNSTIMLASFLDPRHKRLLFLSDQQRESVHTMALEKLNSGSAQGQDGGASTSPDTESTSDVQPNEGALSFLLGSFYEDETDCAIVTPKTSQEELDMYNHLKPVSGGMNPFKWWAVNATSFPRLAALARSILCIPGTEVPSERVFSAAGGTVSKRRTLLSPSTVDKLVFLHKFGMQESKLQKAQIRGLPVVTVKQEPPCDIVTPAADDHHNNDIRPRDVPQPAAQPPLPQLKMEVDDM